MQISRVDTARCRGGEGPLWDVEEQALYFIDNSGQKAHRYDPASGETRSWDMPSTITALAVRESGGVVVTLRTGIYALDCETGALYLLYALPGPPPFIFN